MSKKSEGVEVVGDSELTIEDMEQQFYQGFPAWRKDGYEKMKALLKEVGTDQEWDQYEKCAVEEQI